MSLPKLDASARPNARGARQGSALVIDDDDSVRSLITYILRRQAFEVESASDPSEALALLERRYYDVVVFDPRLNDPRSWEMLEALEDRVPSAVRRVVIITAAVDALAHGLPADVCRVVTKPFEIQQLVEAVEGCAAEE